MTTSTSTAERLARIETILEGQAQALIELRTSLTKIIDGLTNSDKTLDDRLKERENFCAARVVYTNTIGQDMTQIKNRLDTLEKLAPAMRVVIWMGGLLGASVLALIWALITGQAQIVF